MLEFLNKQKNLTQVIELIITLIYILNKMHIELLHLN
jgi:hypothetical protein